MTSAPEVNTMLGNSKYCVGMFCDLPAVQYMIVKWEISSMEISRLVLWSYPFAGNMMSREHKEMLTMHQLHKCNTV